MLPELKQEVLSINLVDEFKKTKFVMIDNKEFLILISI